MDETKLRVSKKRLCKGDLFQKRADAWRARLAKEMGGVSQKRFSIRMQKRLKKVDEDATCSQKSVSNWLHVGDAGHGKAFPAYEVMIQIAEELHVDVGYLTGETDGEAFDAVNAGEYLGLSVEATEALHRLTFGLHGPFGYKYGPDPLVTKLLNDLLTSDELRVLLLRMRDFAIVRDRYLRAESAVDKAKSRYSVQIIEKAEYVLKNPRLPPISFVDKTVEDYWLANKDVLLEAGITYTMLRGVLVVASELDSAILDLDDEDFERDITETAYRYQLQMLFGKLVEEIFPPLPRA